MNILQEIYKWASTLSTWQQDAISRLITHGTLTSGDLDDIYALMKTAHGISDAQARVAQPINPNNISPSTKQIPLVQLTAIRDLENVNALAPKQTLPIAPTGLTAIYGGNGAGKSGYSRVLKKACRARDQVEIIRPNAMLPPNKNAVATATFDFLVNGVSSSVTWIDQQISPEALSSVAIFDSRCARAYIDEQDDFSYVPYGLDVLESAAKSFNILKSMAETEILKSTPNTLPYLSLSQTNTAAGNILKNISSDTKISTINALADLSDAELIRLAIIQKTLKEGNPKEKIQQLTLRHSRFSKLAERCNDKKSHLNNENLIQLKSSIGESNTASAAADLVAKHFYATPGTLHGTGGEAWKELFMAARKFSKESHPDQDFPHLSSDSACPLCQQTLKDASKRIVEFDKFIQGQTEKIARQKKLAAKSKCESFINLDLNLQFDADLKAELLLYNNGLAERVEMLQQRILAERLRIKIAISENKDWGFIEPSLDDPIKDLLELVELIKKELEILLQATDEKQLVKLEAELNELSARQGLALIRSSVADAITKFSHQKKLKSCLPSLKTNSISAKSSELVDKVVSKGLADALNIEFAHLNVEHLQIALRSSTIKGKTFHKLTIKMPTSISPGEILSEGEQRAIAIASFLAEVNIGGGSGGIVFDDPMSSLDHIRRELVARRLVAESVKRQVIVFTHDLYFLSLLQHEAAQLDAPLKALSLRRTPEGFGVASDTLPFDGAGSKARIGILKTMQVEAAMLLKNHDDDACAERTRQTYHRLRDAWERAVEEVLFNGVVWRFKPGISTQSLREVAVEDSDYLAIQAAMTKCSKYAHDASGNSQLAVPLPKELLEDIEKLDAWRDAVITRRKKLTQDRPK